MYEFIEKPKSITKLLQHSPFIKDMYVNNRERCKEHVQMPKTIRDFAYAPQRYDSSTKVMVRLVLTFDAAICTAVQVITARNTTVESQACLELVRRLDMEMCIQLAMMADCSLEVERFVRLCDGKSGPDETELVHHIDHLVSLLKRLFTDGMCPIVLCVVNAHVFLITFRVR